MGIDANFLYHFTPPWAENPKLDDRAMIVAGVLWEESERCFRLVVGIPVGTGTKAAGTGIDRMIFSVPVRLGEHKDVDGRAFWGLRKLGPGVWAVTPMLIAPHVFQAYVTLVGVPEPAPFVLAREGGILPEKRGGDEPEVTSFEGATWEDAVAAASIAASIIDRPAPPPRCSCGPTLRALGWRARECPAPEGPGHEKPARPEEVKR